jgi:Na+:H+ antiporter, NhaA family
MAPAPAPSRHPRTASEVLISPFVRFAQQEASGAILLLACTVAALVIANSAWGYLYEAMWHTEVIVRLGRFAVSESRHHWINDGLMTIFFFLVGLEIKREVLSGELSSLRQAAFPFIAALGGSIFPAVIYIMLNYGGEGARGWGIPMATDIAFALGVLALLGRRVPIALKIFVAALAIADDIFAVLIIAFFYTAQISYVRLGLGLAGITLSLLANWAGVRKPLLYALIGIFVWVVVLNSGVHATIAGVLLAFTIPASIRVDRPAFLRSARSLLEDIERAPANSPAETGAVHALQAECELIQSPLQRVEHRLQPWVAFLIMPLFALANAGVHLLGDSFSRSWSREALGVIIGLLVGKPLGIFLFAWLSAKWRVATRPAGVSWNQIFAAGCLCGIGFTMSLFVATLAFESGPHVDSAKIGILMASLASGIIGGMLLLRGSGKANNGNRAQDGSAAL